MRRTWVVAALAGGAAVLLIVAVLVVVRLGDRSGPSKAVETYLARWERADWAGMRRLVADPPSDFAAVHERMTKDLRVDRRRLRAGAVTRRGDEADAAFDAVLDLSGLGQWQYQGRLALVRRDGDWLVRWSPGALHPRVPVGGRLARARAWPARAAILATDGTPLTAEGLVVRVGIEPRRVKDRAALTAALAQHANVDPARVERLLGRPGLRPDEFVPVIDLREERYAAVRAVLQPVPGLVFRRTSARLTPSEGFARHTVGRVGEVTAERLQELGKPYQVGDHVGLSGLEMAEERTLAGTPSGEVRTLDAAGKTVEVLHRFPGTPGRSVQTTLSAQVQTAAERALDGVAQPAALVAVDTATSQIRAVASRPLDQSFNRALAGRYPPGSTFKIVTATALLAAGTRADTSVDCPEEAVVGGKPFRNFEGEGGGAMPFHSAFAHSCNTAFVKAAVTLPGPNLSAAARAYGFDTDYRLPVGVAGGRFPTPRDDAERAAAGIGQGRVTASPLHMATVVGAVAAGAWRPPTLRTADGPPGAAEQLDPAAVATLRGLLREVVTSGTGTAAEVRGRAPAGKTGTAEFGQGSPPPTHAWFVGYAGSVAFAVLVEGGGVGGRVAAPIAARFVGGLPPLP